MVYSVRQKKNISPESLTHLSRLSLESVGLDTLLKLDITRRDHVSVVMDAGSRIVNFIVNFIRDGTVFA